MTDTSALLQRLPGTPFPDGRYTVERYAQLVLCSILDAEQARDGTAHPLFHYIAPQCGAGWSVEDLFRILECRAEDGPMVAECTLDVTSPLRVGATYDVTGEIVSLERKHGRRAGAFDLFTFRLEVRDPATGEEASRMTNVWVLPRKEADVSA